MSEVQLAVDARNQLGEGVLWCERSERVWWTDIQRGVLWCHVPATGKTSSWNMPERLGSFALTQDDGTLLLGLASRLAFFHLSTGIVDTICEIEPEQETTRLNDGRCDRFGNFVFGTLNEEPRRAKIGSFYRLNADLHLEKLPLGGVAIPNSICFSPDGRSMYYCDSTVRTIHCCDYGPWLDDICNDRIFVDLRGGPGSPDGSTVDSRGGVWNAQWGASRVVRYAPDGSRDCIIPVPVSQPSCVCFGGSNLTQLYITTARDELPEDVLEMEPTAGGLFRADLQDVRGLPECRFGSLPRKGI
jgi:L-arabinonolactonase